MDRSTDNDRLVDAIAGMLPPLLNTLDALEFAGRHLHPAHLDRPLTALDGNGDALAAARRRLDDVPWPERLEGTRQALLRGADLALEACALLRGAGGAPDGMTLVRRAGRRRASAQESLFPLTRVLPPVNRFFVGEGARADGERLARLAAPARDDVGVFHFANAIGERGGHSLFVPEDIGPDRPGPVVFALHGGGGHGRHFLWSWMRACRSVGAILVAPTSSGSTWALMGDDPDTPRLTGILAGLAAAYPTDRKRVLLTGMSDGGTFAYVSALPNGGPWTHLAPFAASFHPMLLEFADPERLRGLPVRLVHGALDWMFPVSVARAAAEALRARGAAVRYREIPDLAHTFPAEECAATLAWLTGSGAAPARRTS